MQRKKAIALAAAALLALPLSAQQYAEDFRQPQPLGTLSPSENFTGNVWLYKISQQDSLQLPMFNVTFAPGCINSWHYHTRGQVLIAEAGSGYYQVQGKPARRLQAGDIVEIAPNTIHWHGAAPDSWFSHVALMPNPETNKTVWLQPVGESAYRSAVSESLQPVTDLSAREQAIVSIGAFTGAGDLDHLTEALRDGLQAGMTVNEIKEMLVHAYAYAGFPRSLRAINTFMALLEERKATGINDPVGREASPIKAKGTKYDRGAAVLEQLTGQKSAHPTTGYGAFAPAIDQFLKEHLFADLFERDLLSYRERELTTVSILAGVGGVEPMAQAYMGICLRLGITPAQLTALLNQVENKLGRCYAEPLRPVLAQLTSTRKG